MKKTVLTTPKKLQKAISKNQMVDLNSPSNPTGVGYTKDEIEDLAKVPLKIKFIF